MFLICILHFELTPEYLEVDSKIEVQEKNEREKSGGPQINPISIKSDVFGVFHDSAGFVFHFIWREMELVESGYLHGNRN